MKEYTIERGLLYEGNKKVIVQIGNMLFECLEWGKVKNAKDLAKLLNNKRYSIRLLKEVQ